MSEKTNSGFIIPDYNEIVDVPTLIRQNADVAEEIIKSTGDKCKKLDDAIGGKLGADSTIDGGTY